MKHSCYVIVCTDGSDCWTRIIASSVEGLERSDWEEGHLEGLLRMGWRPLRETAMSNDNSYAYSLVVLEKDAP